MGPSALSIATSSEADGSVDTSSPPAIDGAMGRLLRTLEAVRKTGPDQNIARCPAHDDGRPSLSIKRVDDRLLIHCFAGCSADSDQARNALKALKHECIVVWCMSEQMRAGFSLDPDQHDRLELALDRIARAAEIAA